MEILLSLVVLLSVYTCSVVTYNNKEIRLLNKEVAREAANIKSSIDDFVDLYRADSICATEGEGAMISLLVDHSEKLAKLAEEKEGE